MLPCFFLSSPFFGTSKVLMVGFVVTILICCLLLLICRAGMRGVIGEFCRTGDERSAEKARKRDGNTVAKHGHLPPL